MTEKNKEKNEIGNLLKSRVFTLKDQLDFAEFSGDKNPIHINSLEARRTIAGQCIVHGINSLLWALDTFVFSTGLTFSSCKAKFQNSVFLNETIDCFWNEESNKLSLVSNSIVLCSIRLELGPVKKVDSMQIPICKTREVPEARSFKECVSLQTVPLSFFGNPEMAKQLFPSFFAEYGKAAVCDLALISEIVGMQVPGLNSLFLSVQANFLENKDAKFFRIEKSDSRYGTMELAITASTIRGLAQVVFRPSPQKSKSIDELSKHVKKGEFKNVNALIIGGSRGLGEMIAKLIACGGGKSVITYNSGLGEATRLKNEITSHGEMCDILQLSVGKNNNVLDPYKGFNQLYYFATPKIFGKRSLGFNETLYNTFVEVYVKGFAKVCDKLILGTEYLAVFYPSSIAIEKPLASLEEYIAAKLEGEEFCKKLNNKTNMAVYYPRLPRIDTDQTLSLIKAISADPVEVLLPHLREMTNNSKYKKPDLL